MASQSRSPRFVILEAGIPCVYSVCSNCQSGLRSKVITEYHHDDNLQKQKIRTKCFVCSSEELIYIADLDNEEDYE